MEIDLPIIDFDKCGIHHIDASKEDVKKVGDTICEAFARSGFIYIKNSGIEFSDVARTYAKAKEFFGLDMETKRKYLLSWDFYGYTPPDFERFTQSSSLDNREGFDVAGGAFTSPSTVWPDQHVPEFSKTMKGFGEKAKKLTNRFMESVAAGLNFEDRLFYHKFHKYLNQPKNFTTIRINHFPTIPDDYDVTPGQLRLPEHTDLGTFSFIFPDGNEGLEAIDKNGDYHAVPIIPDTIVVVVGDMSEKFTKGILEATKHRVVMPKKTGTCRRERHSLVYVVRPDNEASITVEKENGDKNSKSNKETNFFKLMMDSFGPSFTNSQLRESYLNNG